MRAAIYATAFATLSACAANTGLARCDAGSSEHVCARVGEPFDVRVGQTAYVADTPLSVRVEGVPEDSRCPRDVQCVWAGNARVVLELRNDDSAGISSVNSTLQPRAVTRWDWRVELLKVEPETSGGQPIAQDQYRIRLVVNRLS